MKTRVWLVIFICAVGFPYKGISQCGTIRTITYDTTVTGNGSADPGYNFAMPKFNPALGTLTSVRLASVVKVTFSYNIENRDPAPKTTKVRVSRTDEISGPTISTESIDTYSGITTFNLSGSDGVTGSGPDFRAVPPFNILNNDTVINKVYSNTAPYIGPGTVSFVYRTDVGSQTNGNPNVNISGAATDVVKFSITYTYCDNVLLASEITAFSASRKAEYVNLHWLTSNELPNRLYELQKSTDGKNFTTIATVTSSPGFNQTGNYEYNDVPLSTEKNKLYYRIKQVENGRIKYSPVRIVDLGETTENKSVLQLSPNPSTGVFAITLTNSTAASNWLIELFNIKGQVISKKLAENATLSKFSMNESLKPGVYFVMVTNKSTKQRFVERLIVN